jgi:hypothetical protein
MKNILNFKLLFFASLLFSVGCSEPDYEFGDLSAPSNIELNAELVGQTEDNPYGDGSGEVILTVTGDDVMTYMIDYGTTTAPNFVPFKGNGMKRYTTPGTNTYIVSVIAYGRGGTATNMEQEITVNSVYEPNPEIISSLLGEPDPETSAQSKTWVVDKSVPGHLGVGPFTGDGSTSPVWWAASVNEKVGVADCLYSATYTFSREGENSYSLDVDAPEGAFTKTGDLTTLPGIPDSGAEDCYSEYSGGSSEFAFGPASSGFAESTPSTQTSINLVGNETFIGYGAVQKEYEILEVSPDYLYLRVQGTETGNAWYLKLVPAE